MIMIEASPLSIPQWYVDLGEKSLTKEEETFYVAVLVKPFLSSSWSVDVLFPHKYLRLRRCDLCSGRSKA
jgi:hypothetical protein